MKVAIVGTRGIPNIYGGFEQFAQEISIRLIEKGIEVVVYRDKKLYPDSDDRYINGVEIRDVLTPKILPKILQQHVYDWYSIKDLSQSDIDIALFCGHSTSFPGILFFKKKLSLITIVNPDGIEWKRKSGNLTFFLQLWNLISERLSLRLYDHIVSDNVGIQKYLYQSYGLSSDCITYGVDINPMNNTSEKTFSASGIYDLIVARIVPENNIEMIISGYLKSVNTEKLIVIGNISSNYANKLVRKYSQHNKIKFIGGVYDRKLLNSYIQNSRIYFHGHSVGGTNPSLLEAMALKAHIYAHSNIFNKSLLEENAWFFEDKKEVSELINNYSKSIFTTYSLKNYSKVCSQNSWEVITTQYINLFKKVLYARNNK